MKRIMKQTGSILILAVLTCVSHPAFAADPLSGSETPQPMVHKRTEAEQKILDEKRKQIEVKRTDLNGSSWDVVFVTSTDPKRKGEKDVLTFQNGQFKSKNLAARGFNWTNYTISVPNEPSELAVWETMQSGKEGLVFIRGEWTKDKMTGNITEQLDGGKKVIENSFTTNLRTAISPTSEEAKEGGPAAEALSPAESSQQVKSSDTLVSLDKPKSISRQMVVEEKPALIMPAQPAGEPNRQILADAIVPPPAKQNEGPKTPLVAKPAAPIIREVTLKPQEVEAATTKYLKDKPVVGQTGDKFSEEVDKFEKASVAPFEPGTTKEVKS